jgi:hypothetical protein
LLLSLMMLLLLLLLLLILLGNMRRRMHRQRGDFVPRIRSKCCLTHIQASGG